MIDIQMVEGTPVARIQGDIDMSNIGSIEDAIRVHVKSSAFGFVVDLSGVTYLDSAGIRLLYQLDERTGSRQQGFVIVVPPGAQINRTLEAAGAIGSLRIMASTDQAIDALRRSKDGSH